MTAQPVKNEPDNGFLYLGLMSGTSIDGIDVALVKITNNNCQLIASHLHPINADLKVQLHKLCSPGFTKAELYQTSNANDDIDLLGELDHQLGLLFAEAANQILTNHDIDKKNIRAVGSHGQTIRHRPSHNSPFTLQIGDANLIAYLTAIPTVADFRRMDMAAGGQGAPLVPAFHKALMASDKENRIILNLGGIANITYLPKSTEEAVVGFDCGPANTLLDNHFKQHHQKYDYDHNGEFARSGRIDQKLLTILINDPYFKLLPPKSTGREYFSTDWLQQNLNKINHSISPASIQATLLELTVQTIVDSIKEINIADFEVYVCGGGMHNSFMIDELAKKLNKKIFKTNQLGIDGDYLEAMTFAWLAHQRLENLTGNLTSVTGAKENKVLGAIYHP